MYQLKEGSYFITWNTKLKLKFLAPVNRERVRSNLIALGLPQSWSCEHHLHILQSPVKEKFSLHI